MRQKQLYFIVSFLLSVQLQAQLIIPVYDSQALGKRVQDFAVNIIKAEQQRSLLEHQQETLIGYTSIVVLQQKIQEDLKQANSVEDLKWSDLSKALYLADELVNGIREAGVEIEFTFGDHPVFESSVERLYQDLFLLGADGFLPDDYNSLQQAKQQAKELENSFAYFAAQRKAYAAVAFQYLSEDLMAKAMEMNTLLKEPGRFAMTQAERMQLQLEADEYLVLSKKMLGRSDDLLLQVAATPAARREADEQAMKLERAALVRMTLFDK